MTPPKLKCIIINNLLIIINKHYVFRNAFKVSLKFKKNVIIMSLRLLESNCHSRLDNLRLMFRI